MSEKPDNLLKQLAQLDLSEDEGKLYVYGLRNKSFTALKASKDLKTARTKIYRLIEKLTEKGLILEKIEGYGKKFIAVKPERLYQLVNDKERDLLLLKSSLPSLVSSLENYLPKTSLKTQILHYSGAEGLKQVTWNTTKSKGIFRIYEVNLMHSFLDHSFSEKVRQEFVKNRIKVHQLTNHTEFGEFTDVFEHIRDTTLKHISKSVLDIRMEIAIYNDVVVMYEYESDNVFIVEIYNEVLAKEQKQIFDIIWQTANPMKFISPKGAAKLG